MIANERIRTAWAYAAPILLGLFLSLVGSGLWIVAARLNARIHPEIPWSAGATLLWLVLFLAWLNGAGPPARWKAARRFRLRLWRPDSSFWSKQGLAITASLMGANLFLALLWILMAAPDRPPDLSHYPTTVYLVSIVLMGPLVTAVTEEAAFRGYMQRGLERFGSGTAITVTALVFTLAHLGHGLQELVLLGPGTFIAGLIYGALAYHSRSIVPGMIIHFLGNLTFIWFAELGGDWRLLIVS